MAIQPHHHTSHHHHHQNAEMAIGQFGILALDAGYV